MPTTANTAPGQIHEPGGSSWSPTWEQEPKGWGHLELLPQGHQQATGSQVEQLGFELAMIWDGRTAGNYIPFSLQYLSVLHLIFNYVMLYKYPFQTYTEMISYTMLPI